MKIQPIRQNNYTSSVAKKNVSFSGANLNAVMRNVKGPSTINEWITLFHKLINTAKQERGFYGDKYFRIIDKSLEYSKADNICEEISRACKEYYGSGYEGRYPIGEDSAGTSILLCKESDYPAFLRFISDTKNVDLGLSQIGSKKYQFYRDGNCDIQYHNQRFGGTIRRFRTPFGDEKFFNPDGSKDWGRGLRDLWESLTNG